ncbi:uncharacterized protein MELLADRAFT_78762 [Melampsora larici-populina 98AG31]|uniref:Nucleosome assembly protein n=1 Tax=Melampsora larici-populina (strain 98AG31 / pathotype 3-4-7) TaxID=747676 RepID=F4RYC8_MELLP|nr:uncharacterized protein MELLADRAFT_78762 [Melampsora larici-populina 98AG31]EGG02653.1 hypothetical protein MELLADRAFT_78762 [Melampsora larici-populina 98AG31]
MKKDLRIINRQREKFLTTPPVYFFEFVLRRPVEPSDGQSILSIRSLIWNTPAAHLSVSQFSRPQVPDHIGEDEAEEDIPTKSSNAAAGGAAAEIAGHPLLASLVQSRFNGLVGRYSGYIESLPAPIRQRVDGLNGIQAEHAELKADFQKDVLELEKKYAHRYGPPLYERRAEIIAGKIEPSSQKIAAGIKMEEDEESDDEDDEAALKHLEDIRVAYLDGKPGFKLTFSFGPGAKEFFENENWEETYYYQDTVGYAGDYVYEKAEGTKILWKTGKDLTVKIETKKQRNKNTNRTRVVKKVIPTDSFFTFFSPPTPPAEEDNLSEGEQDDIEQCLELDYQIGEDLKERIIPRAIDFFTGKALRFEEGVDDELLDEFDDDNDDDDDDDDDDEDGDAPDRLVVPGARKS